MDERYLRVRFALAVALVLYGVAMFYFGKLADPRIFVVTPTPATTSSTAPRAAP